MAITIRAHFDGKVIVPDEPVDLPINQPLRLELIPASGTEEAADLDERRAALERLVSRAHHDLSVPDEALRREALYEERT